jgi:predicted nucleic acid-binding protein
MMRPFFDTNVLVYAFDEGEAEKRAVALRLIQEHLEDGEGMISVQVLREFYVSVRWLSRPLSVAEAEIALELFARFSPASEDGRMVVGAVSRSREFMLSFWDALILEAALRSGADTLLTEDLQHGQRIEGLTVVNPFLETGEI